MKPNTPLRTTSEGVGGLTDEISREAYDRLAPVLAELGVFDVSRDFVVNYCQAYSIAQRGYAELDKAGVTLSSDKGGVYMNPAGSAWKMACNVMDTAAGKLGVDPKTLAETLEREADEAEDKKVARLSDFAANG